MLPENGVWRYFLCLIMWDNSFINEDMLEKGGVLSMAEHVRLPVGVDRFEKIRREDFYYVDKTLLIEKRHTAFSLL